MSEFIEFQDVKKIYKMGEVEIPALAGVSFTIQRGEFVVIAGASGAGKSTILNILGGMDTCTSGNIFVDGAEVSRMNARELCDYRRLDIGFVFQFYNLVQNLTAKETWSWRRRSARIRWILTRRLKRWGCGKGKTIFLLSFPAVNNSG